jgi:ribulose kinase
MFADTLGIPIVIPTVHEVALIGSAMIAFTAEGRYPDLITASHKMIIAGVRIEPDPARARIHEEHYAFFKELRSGMSELYQRHSRLSGEIVKAS